MLSNKTVKRAAGVILTTFLVGCATPPSKIQAAYVSPLQYSHYSCNQIQAELMSVNGRVIEVTGSQKKQSTNDAVAMGVGLVIFWPALFFLASGDKGDELARLKGQYEALESAAIQKNCNIAKELREARKQRDAYKASEAEKNREQQKAMSGADL